MPLGDTAYLKIYDSSHNDRKRQPFDRHSTAQSDEQSKRAIRSNLDWIELSIHLLGPAATSVVISLHAASHYWVDLGDDGSLSINATLKYLQVAAKLHETAMMASIFYVLLFLLHRRLIKRGVSFGHLDAPYMIGAGGGIGLLVTKRFWSPWRQHLSFSLILLFSILLTLALNPASAIAMIPSLAYWSISNPFGLDKGSNFKVYFSLPGKKNGISRLPSPWPTAEPAAGWPVSTAWCSNENVLPQQDCPIGGMEPITQWMHGNILSGSSTNLTINEVTNFQRLLVSQPLEADTGDFSKSITRRVTTTPTSLSTLAIGGFWAYIQDRNIGEMNSRVRLPLLTSKEGSSTYQPLVYSQCQSDFYSVDKDRTIHNVTFDAFRAPWADNHKLSDYRLSHTDIEAVLSETSSHQPRFAWFHVDSLSVVSFTILPIQRDNASEQAFQSSLAITCSFDARWAASTIKLRPRSSSRIESNLADFSVFEEKHIRQRYGSKDQLKRALNISELVELPANWLKPFTTNITDHGRTMPAMEMLFTDMTETTPEGNQHFQITKADEPKMIGYAEFTEYQRRVTDFVGKYQSMLLTDGLARYNYWLWRPFLEIPSPTGDDYRYVDLFGLNWIRTTNTSDEVFLNGTKADAFYVEFDTSRYGYGYGFTSDDTGFGIYLAIAVLGLYETIIIVYLVMIFWYRCNGRYTRSEAWETMINLVALAKNSDASPYLVGTSAGVENWNTWKLKVKIREKDGESLDLAFMRGDEDTGVEPGVMKKYA